MRAGPAPVRPGDDVELRMARAALLAVAVLAVPSLAAAGLLAGHGGLLGAGVATGVVAGMFLMAGALTSWAARSGPAALMAAVLGGYLLRLVVYALLIVLLRPVEAISAPSLALTAAVLLLGALAWEVRVVSATPGFFWLHPAAGGAPGTGPVVYSRDSAAGAAVTRAPGHQPSDRNERTGS